MVSIGKELKNSEIYFLSFGVSILQGKNMYKVGAFTDYGDQKQPGVYTRLEPNPAMSHSSLTTGVVALPWKTYSRASEPEPVRITKSNLSTQARSLYPANPDAFLKIVSNLLAKTTEVRVCPYNHSVMKTVVQDDAAVESMGWSEDGNVEIKWTPSKDAPQSLCQPLRVDVSIEGDDYDFRVYFPFPDNTVDHVTHKLMPKTSFVDGTVTKVEVGLDTAIGAFQKLYGEKITLTVKIQAALTSRVTVMIGGGRPKLTVNIARGVNLAIEKTKGLTAGALIAIPYNQNDFVDLIAFNVLYMKDTVCPASSECFGVAELKDQKVTLTLYTRDRLSGRTEARVVQQKPFKMGAKESDAPIRDILKLLDCVDESEAVDPDPKTDAWAKKLQKDTDRGVDMDMRVGFFSYHSFVANEDGVKSEMSDFMTTIGKTNVGTVFHIPDTSRTGVTREKNKELYQLIQKTYIDNFGSLCPGTQLVMDETWMTGCRDWALNTEPLTISSPFCVSLAGDSRGGFVSLLNSAYMVGLMAKCGVVRSATAARYPGSDLVMYPQSIIEHMHEVGVVTWHSHAGEKMIYLDSSSYRNNKSYEGLVYSKAFERNRPIRSVNRFRMDAAQNFFRNFFEQNWYGDDAAGAIRRDLLKLIHEMADSGVFKDDIQYDDVLVTNLDSRSFTATVRLRLIESPEILYISLEV